MNRESQRAGCHAGQRPGDLIDRAGSSSASGKAPSNQGKSVEIALELETMSRATVGRRTSTVTFVDSSRLERLAAQDAVGAKPSRGARPEAPARSGGDGEVGDLKERVQEMQEQQQIMKEAVLERQDNLQADVQELRSDVQGLRAAIDQLTRTMGGAQVRTARRASGPARSAALSSPAPSVEQIL